VFSSRDAVVERDFQPVKIDGEDHMELLIKIFEKASEILISLVTKAETAQEQSWDRFESELDKICSLTKLHMEAINNVAEPILTHGDIIETAKRYLALAHNIEFPSGYDRFRGYLHGIKNISLFQRGAVIAQIDSVTNLLVDFQQIAFTKDFDSYGVADAMNNIAKAYQRPDFPDTAFSELTAPYFATLKNALYEEDNLLGHPPASRTDAVELLQHWASSWIRTAQRALRGQQKGSASGFYSAVEQLKILRHIR
jgi:hypothetical protein